MPSRLRSVLAILLWAPLAACPAGPGPAGVDETTDDTADATSAEAFDAALGDTPEELGAEAEAGQDVSGPSSWPYEPHTVLDVPLDGASEIADPHVIRVGSVWVLYATCSGQGLRAWTSEDLLTWSDAGLVWTPTPGTWNAGGGYWAPHVQATAGGYYLYYTADLMIGVARADSPLGPFEEIYDHPFVGAGHGGIGDGVYRHRGTAQELLDYEENAIDAFVLEASDGSLTLYFTAYTPLSAIYAVPMVDYATLADDPPMVVLAPDTDSWEFLVTEGTWVVERSGVFHLMYSGNGANTPDYGVGVAEGPTPFGPFVKRSDNPILHQSPAAGFWGPGHHCLTEGPVGERLMFYHTKTTPDVAWDRRLRYAPVGFDGAGHLQLLAPQP